MPQFQCKESYYEVLGFNRITHENWLLPDRKNYAPFGKTKEEWTGRFLEPRVDEAVCAS